MVVAQLTLAWPAEATRAIAVRPVAGVRVPAFSVPALSLPSTQVSASPLLAPPPGLAAPATTPAPLAPRSALALPAGATARPMAAAPAAAFTLTPAAALPAPLAASFPASLPASLPAGLRAAQTPTADSPSIGASLAAFGAPVRERPDTALDLHAHAAARGFEFDVPRRAVAAEPSARGGVFGSLAAPNDAPKPRLSPPSTPAAARPAPRRVPILLWALLGNLVLTQLGVEALGLAVPLFGAQTFGYGTLATISAVSSVALATGSLLGGQVVDRIGPERTYTLTLAARASAIGALALLHSTVGLSAPALIAFFAADYILHYMNYVAIDTLAPRRLGGDAVALNRFGLWRQVVVDGVGFFGPIGAGATIAAFGFSAVFWAYPALFAVATAAGLLLLRGRNAGDAGARAPPKSVAWGTALREIRGDPALTWSIVSFAAFTVASIALYFIVAPSFGAFVAGASGSAAQVAAVMTGLFAGGGVLGAWAQSRVTARLARDAAGDGETARRGLIRSMGWATVIAGVTLLAFWSLLWTSPLFALPLLGPVYAVQLLMLPFGAAVAVPLVGLLSVVQSRATEGAQAKVAGINRSAATTASFVFSYVLGGALAVFAAGNGPSAASFAAAALLLSGLGALAAFSGWRLIRAASLAPALSAALLAPPAALPPSAPDALASAPLAAPVSRRRHLPTPEETARARAVYLRFAREGQEIFDAPTWVEKALEPDLKAAFAVAEAEDMLVDFANAVPADLPLELAGDPVDAIVAQRDLAYRRWEEAHSRFNARSLGGVRSYALRRLESMHRAGILIPALEGGMEDAHGIRAAYARLHQLAFGDEEPSRVAVREAIKAFSSRLQAATAPPGRELRRRALPLAVEADAVLSRRGARAPPAEAKAVYDRSVREVKKADPENLRHALARQAAMHAGTLLVSPNLGKQLRPTCTLHMLRGLLASLGVHRSMPDLVREARALLNDPFVGATTAFDDELQQRLFRHYGVVEQLSEGRFETIVRRGTNLRIRIEIGEVVYKHTLILEGFYELDGKLYASLRDSTSYFPTRMEISDLGRVLTDDPALLLSEPR